MIHSGARCVSPMLVAPGTSNRYEVHTALHNQLSPTFQVLLHIPGIAHFLVWVCAVTGWVVAHSLPL